MASNNGVSWAYRCLPAKIESRPTSDQFTGNRNCRCLGKAKTVLTQSCFADVLDVSKRALENWEQRRRLPTNPAQTLLKILVADPEFALYVLQQYKL